MRGEEIVALVSVPAGADEGNLLLATQQGQVKRIRLRDLPGVSAHAFPVLKLAAQDALLQVLVTDGASEVLLASAHARAIRFDENEVRHTGLSAGGVRGMNLSDRGDRVVGAVVARDTQYLWTISGDGLAQCAPAREFPRQGRGGRGVLLTSLPEGNRGLVARDDRPPRRQHSGVDQPRQGQVHAAGARSLAEAR